MYSLSKNYKEFPHGNKMHYALRIASAMCCIGHGSFGIITKAIWANYFAVFGIEHATSYSLMPFVGCFDILCGIIILIYPIRVVLLWLVFWGFVTALLRPLSGEPLAEFIERAGNFGAPLTLLVISGAINLQNIFKPVHPCKLQEKTLSSAIIVLRIAVCLILVGHGWLNVMEKKGLLDQYVSLGFGDPGQLAHIIGFFEIFAGISVLFKPVRSFVFLLFIWKMASELFYPHYELFEWIERAGSYGCILALWLALGRASVAQRNVFFRNVRLHLFKYQKPELHFAGSLIKAHNK
jgi:uncharacterized membrane protein YphA (DoxX/SURF4 family)